MAELPFVEKFPELPMEWLELRLALLVVARETSERLDLLPPSKLDLELRPIFAAPACLGSLAVAALLLLPDVEGGRCDLRTAAALATGRGVMRRDPSVPCVAW